MRTQQIAEPFKAGFSPIEHEDGGYQAQHPENDSASNRNHTRKFSTAQNRRNRNLRRHDAQLPQ